MEAVESNPATLDLEAEIAKTTEQLQKLREAEESFFRRQRVFLDKLGKMDEQIYRNKHRKIKKWIDKLIPLIESLEKFPNRPEPDFLRIQVLLSPTAKELAEPTQKLKVQFQHRNVNLVTERKLAKEFRQQKEVEDKQHVDRIKQEKMQKNRYYSDYRSRGWRVLPKKNTQALIRIWAEEVLYVSSLVLHDSKNLDAKCRNTDCHLLHLWKTTCEFYGTQNIGRAEFEKHWGTMKCDKKSLEDIKFELMKESRRHQEGYDESERLFDKKWEFSKSFDVDRDEWRSINKEERAARKYLWKLKCKQKEAAG